MRNSMMNHKEEVVASKQRSQGADVNQMSK
jgi:hypothetical protein